MDLMTLIALCAVVYAVIAFIVFVERGQRRIPIAVCESVWSAIGNCSPVTTYRFA